MKQIICILFLLYNILLFADNPGNTIVITPHDIKSSGYFRISDLLQTYTGYNFSTTHGFLDYFSFAGLESYQHQNYDILINDHEISMNLLGVKSINSLPIDLNNIDSIKIILAPNFHLGQIRSAGAISFYTDQTHNKKYYLKNTIILGNESKDTGPYRFTALASPNVDKTGTDYTGSFGYNFSGHQLTAAYHYRQHIYTDWSTRNRIRQLKSEKQWPMLIEYGGSIMSQGTMLNTHYSLFLSTIKTDNLYFFYEPAGHEFPLDYYDNYLGLDLNRNLSRHLAINFNMNYETQFTDNKLRTGIREKQSGLESFQSTVELDFNQHSFLKKAGLHLKREKLLSSINAASGGRVIPGIFLDFKFTLFDLGEITISEVFNLYQNDIYEHYLMSFQNKRTSKINYDLILSASQNLYDYSVNDLWLQKDYLSPRLSIITDKGQNQKYTADLNINFQWNRNISIKTNLFTRYFDDYNFFTYDFHFDRDKYSFNSPTLLNQPANGFVQGFTTTLEWESSSALQNRLAVTIQQARGDEAGFTNAWARIPKQLINYQLSYCPTASFSIQVVLQHASKSLWPDYENITGIEYFSTFRENYVYNHLMNSRNRIDINIRKDLWRRKCSIKFMLRNITDQKIYYSPIGASFDMSLFLGLSYTFN